VSVRHMPTVVKPLLWYCRTFNRLWRRIETIMFMVVFVLYRKCAAKQIATKLDA